VQREERESEEDNGRKKCREKNEKVKKIMEERSAERPQI